MGIRFNAMEVMEMAKVVSKDDMETLELMVDRYSLGEMLVALDVIANQVSSGPWNVTPPPSPARSSPAGGVPVGWCGLYR